METTEITPATIFDAYPKGKKVAKPYALKCIERAVKSGYSLEFLLDRTILFAKTVAGMDRKFIPHPSTWYNQERFNDDPETWNPDAVKVPARDQMLSIGQMRAIKDALKIEIDRLEGKGTQTDEEWKELLQLKDRFVAVNKKIAMVDF